MTDEAKRIATILEFVARYKAIAADGHEAVSSIGVGDLDDCAVIPLSDEIDLIVGSDFIRGEGFFLFQEGLLSWRDVGYYLMAANASDLAAMGARPTGALLVFRTSEEMTDTDHDAVIEGVAQACADFGMPLLGGDSGGYKTSVLSASAFGTCPHGKALMRHNGRPGEVVWVSDHLGMAAAANAWFTRGKTLGIKMPPKMQETLLDSWKRPKPAMELGAMLVEKGWSCCAIDTSDGLKAAARQLAEASHVDIVIDAEKIPIMEVTRWVADKMELPLIGLAVGDSVDFRLLFTTPLDVREVLKEAAELLASPVYPIGEVRTPSSKTGGVFLRQAGKEIAMPGIEWDQSNSPSIDRLMSPPNQAPDHDE
jgi:thiamine-monophosphate kinase